MECRLDVFDGFDFEGMMKIDEIVNCNDGTDEICDDES